MRPILTCRSVSKAFYANSPVLRGVDLQLRDSEAVAIIGPNGAGKSTLFNIITGLLAPDSGRCYFDGTDLTSLEPHMVSRLGIGRTFQDVRLVHQISALENVMLASPDRSGEGLAEAICFREKRDAKRKSALSYMKLAELDQYAQDFADNLSYGQQKLLSLICCVAMDPRVLLLDEPISGVHPSTASTIFSLLEKLKTKGKLVVFIEHDLDAVRRLADQVIVLAGGRVIAAGKPTDVLQRAEVINAYVR